MVEISLLGDQVFESESGLTVIPGNGTVIEIPGIQEETEWMRAYSYGGSSTFSPETTFADLLNKRYDPRQIHALSVDAVLKTPVESKLMGAIHNCYDRHLPLALSPEVIWYTILHEIAIHVKKFPEDCAHLFTMKPSEVQKVEVEDNSLPRSGGGDWGRALHLFDEALRPLVPEGSMETFLPKFSTSTPDIDLTLLLAFMDAASPYYAYQMNTMCGIPRIRLNGTPEDWMTLARNTQTLSERVPGLDSWFAELIPVLQKIHATTEGEKDLEFWSSIYKVSNGSGGPHVSGWATTLVAYTFTHKKEVVRKDPQYEGWGMRMRWGGMHTDQFMSHLSSTPFIWNYHGEEVPMTLISGIAGLSLVDGFYTPSLGWAVLEDRK